MSYHSQGLHVWTIDSRYGMINNGGATIDQFGQPHLVAKHRIEPVQLETLVYAGCHDGAFFHYWRKPDGSWHQREFDFCGSRAKFYSDRSGNLFICYMSLNKIRLIASKADNLLQTWELNYTGEEYCRKNEPVADRTRLKEHGILSLVSQEYDGDNWFGDIYVTDLKFNSEQESSFSIEPEADSYIRSGIWADSNYNTETSLIIKNFDHPDFDRKTFVRFDLDLIGELLAEDIVSAKLILDLKTYLHNISDHMYDLYLITDDWEEETITWNNAPLSGFLSDSIPGDSALMVWDVTDVVKDEYFGDGKISFRIEQREENGNPIIHFFSREFNASGMGPRIRINSSSSCLQDIDNTMTKIEEVVEYPSINIFPNPNSQGILNITVLDDFANEKVQISIWNILGQRMLDQMVQPANQSSYTLHIKHLQPGTYILGFRSSNMTISKPFFVVD